MKAAGERSFLWRMMSPLAWPFVLLYAMAVRMKDAAYALHLSKPRRLQRPVISIGNLSVGGTGKTPLVISLAALLQARGWSVDVLSRGYGRSSHRVTRVDPQGNAETFGDEPLLIARRGVPVYVGSERFLAGQLAEVDPAPARAVHLLDDGFQHRPLARTVDIVLLQRADLADDMLPLGRLREPLSALERADICVLRVEDADLKDRVLRLMRQPDPARIWIVERRMILPASPVMSEGITPAAVAFCAIGDAHGFFAGLRRAGIKVANEIAFRDHHAYTATDVDRLRAAARDAGASYFVTTEKDCVRLGSGLRAELEKDCPFVVAGLDVSLCDEARALTTLESLLAASIATPLRVPPADVR